MKYFLLTAVLLVVPSVSSAYFIEDFYSEGQRPEFLLSPQSSTKMVQGWPSWIGRLDDLSLLLFGRRYESLTRDQQVQVRELSKEWPSWIGVLSGYRGIR